MLTENFFRIIINLLGTLYLIHRHGSFSEESDMTQLIDFNSARKNTKGKSFNDTGLEKELLGFTKQLYWSQLIGEYDDCELIHMMYTHLSFQNKGYLEDFIEENPSLKIKYGDLVLHNLKKSAN